MAIKRTIFSGWQLSDEHANDFIEKAHKYKVPPSVFDNIEDGKRLAKEYKENGFCCIVPQVKR